MKIDFLLTTTKVVGGVQTVQRQLSAEFVRAGHEIRVLTVVDDADPRTIGLVRRAWFERLLPERTWERLGLRLTRRLRLRRRAAREGAQKLRDLARPDSILLVMDVPGAEMVLRAHPDTVVLIAHHNSFAAVAGTRDEERLREACRIADALVALTDEDADHFRHAGFPAERIVSIPNAIETNVEPVIDRGSSGLVLAAGRLHPQKSFDVLLRAWAQASSRHRHRLLLAGEGPDRRDLERLRRDLRLDSVTISAPIDVRRALSETDLLVLSSKEEGLPMVILEAMSAGVPVVATDCAPGIRQLLLDPRAGVVVPVGDFAALAQGIDTVLGDESLRATLGRNGREAVKRYRPEAVTRMWTELMLEVSHGEKRHAHES